MRGAWTETWQLVTAHPTCTGNGLAPVRTCGASFAQPRAFSREAATAGHGLRRGR